MGKKSRAKLRRSDPAQRKTKPVFKPKPKTMEEFSTAYKKQAH